MNDFAKLNLSDAEFAGIRNLVFENTGISLADSKQELVKRRFTPRIKELGLSSFASYINYVENNLEKEISNFCNAITTNLTSFFRENHHYEFLQNEALPALERRNSAGGRKLRVWSAGCSTGQEAYCLASILRSSIKGFERWDAKILATDLDEKCLAVAKQGVYAPEGLDKMPADFISKYFEEESQSNGGARKPKVRASASLKQIISFNKLNLIDPKWPMKGKFDVIFCRNVFIYFDKDTQAELLERFAKYQVRGSYLCLGHSESISNPHAVGYRLIGKTTYVRE